MGNPRGFLTIARQDPDKEPVAERLHHAHEFERSLPVLQAREQAARCMGCGVPFCHTGCPLGNVIPDFNELVSEDRWREAFAVLESTNNFPEITGRICPAPCESACVVAINDDAVAIKAIERAIGDRGAAEGWLAPRPRAVPPTGKRVAVVGSGPAGLACAEQLARVGHEVTVLEKDDALGGLLRYGIPDFKLDKALVDARIDRMRAEGITFETDVHVGVTVTLATLRERYDAVMLATGAMVPRELEIPGRRSNGVHLAMDYLVQANRAVAGRPTGTANDAARIDAKDKRVVILGGGDTGSDCLGTALRQGATSVVQIELMPRPPETRAPSTPWPLWPLVYRTSSSQEEGGEREFAVLTKRLLADSTTQHVRALELVRVDRDASGRFVERSGSAFVLPADLVLLALGFTGPDPQTWRDVPALQLGARDGGFATSEPGVFACGDARRGASLVVWAIWEGREAARAIDLYLSKRTSLPSSPYAFAP